MYRKSTYSMGAITKIKVILIAIIIIAICAIGTIVYYVVFKPPEEVITITIGSKRFTEQYILGHMVAELIERNTPYKVIRKVGLGGTAVCHEALLKGDIQIYVEYTGTGFMTILKMNWTAGTSPDQIYETVKNEYQKRWNIIWLPTLGFSDTYCLAMRKAQAEALGVKKISDLKPYAANLVFGGTAEFETRPDGYPGLTKTYGFSFKEYVALDPGLMYIACAQGSVDVISAFSTDARILAYNLTVLTDDKQFFPPYYACIVVRGDLLAKAPALKDLLMKLSGKIDDKTMTDLNYQVDVLKKDPSQVAREFLEKLGLIPK
ncbi:glycine betaine ABC transporter substrate-binding protein [Candidatus Culexarchaeum yellowstonense]|uniref:glycine betaine ABC transporter substrate-binding protein n=1 Tax=Candidatus Culexarchaeum yellowstonense TaxID=2928963 RepID=UPI0026ECA3D7|nr:glycine betaine ABC transporter substrate-binding protein [Candidatus Culexarchaeum yellowstonense]